MLEEREIFMKIVAFNLQKKKGIHYWEFT